MWGVFGSARVCAGMCGCAQVCTGVRGCMLVWASVGRLVWAGVGPQFSWCGSGFEPVVLAQIGLALLKIYTG